MVLGIGRGRGYRPLLKKNSSLLHDRAWAFSSSRALPFIPECKASE